MFDWLLACVGWFCGANPPKNEDTLPGTGNAACFTTQYPEFYANSPFICSLSCWRTLPLGAVTQIQHKSDLGAGQHRQQLLWLWLGWLLCCLPPGKQGARVALVLLQGRHACRARRWSCDLAAVAAHGCCRVCWRVCCCRCCRRPRRWRPRHEWLLVEVQQAPASVHRWFCGASPPKMRTR